MTDSILAVLHKRRVELTAEIKSLNQQLETAIQATEHLDGTIRQFDPAFRGGGAIVQKGRRADMVKTVLGMHRTAHGPRRSERSQLRSWSRTASILMTARSPIGCSRRSGTLTGQRENGTVMSELRDDKRLF